MDKECKSAAYKMIVAKNHPIIHRILFPYINRCVGKVNSPFSNRSELSLKGLRIYFLQNNLMCTPFSGQLVKGLFNANC